MFHVIYLFGINIKGDINIMENKITKEEYMHRINAWS